MNFPWRDPCVLVINYIFSDIWLKDPVTDFPPKIRPKAGIVLKDSRNNL